LGEAVTAFRSSLEVRTLEQFPQDWAEIQTILGQALGLQGNRMGGEKGAQLLGEAVTAFRSALEVFTRAQVPEQWAATQMTLGHTLKLQGNLTDGEEGSILPREGAAYELRYPCAVRAQ
jgi:hypothetical protein